ncbi:KTSC domain-containing protein [Nostocoides japonicum]|nr:KTSC domain-containing protein [Tetrasphaera japonica]
MIPMRHSKALEEMGYDLEDRTLRVRFRSGGLYDYLDVAPEIVEGLLGSAHPWTEWGRRVLEHDVRRLG